MASDDKIERIRGRWAGVRHDMDDTGGDSWWRGDVELADVTGLSDDGHSLALLAPADVHALLAALDEARAEKDALEDAYEIACANRDGAIGLVDAARRRAAEGMRRRAVEVCRRHEAAWESHGDHMVYEYAGDALDEAADEIAALPLLADPDDSTGPRGPESAEVASLLVESAPPDGPDVAG